MTNTIAAGRRSAKDRDIEPLCLRHQDTDNDGDPEWLGLYLSSAEPPRVQGFVLDGETWYELSPVEEEQYGLGKQPTCRLDVEDINTDGRIDIVIWGHSGLNNELLHVFTWRESHYEEIASFQGDAGVETKDVDGKLGQEIVVRYDAKDGLAWETIHSWDRSRYVWIWERYSWLHKDYPHTYNAGDPERAVISFYLALDDRALRQAFRLRSVQAQTSVPYESWALGFDTTLGVEVGSVHEVNWEEARATVTAQVRAYDNLDGYVIGRLWDVTWTVVREDGTWRLDTATSTELERWEAPYKE